MKNQVIYLCAILILVSSCKEKNQVIYFEVPGSLKQACLFGKDSYWIYRNDSTGDIDCTYVNSDPVHGSTTYTRNHVDYIKDYIIMPLESGLYHRFYISGALGNTGSSDGYPFLSSVYRGGGFCNEGRTTFVLHEDGLANHQGDNYYDCGWFKNCVPCESGGDRFFELGEESEFQVNDLNFEKVRLTRAIFSTGLVYFINVNEPIYPIDTIDFFFSSGNGIIKMILRLDTADNLHPVAPRMTQSWSLLRYKISQQ